MSFFGGQEHRSSAFCFPSTGACGEWNGSAKAETEKANGVDKLLLLLSTISSEAAAAL